MQRVTKSKPIHCAFYSAIWMADIHKHASQTLPSKQVANGKPRLPEHIRAAIKTLAKTGGKP